MCVRDLHNIWDIGKLYRRERKGRREKWRREGVDLSRLDV